MEKFPKIGLPLVLIFSFILLMGGRSFVTISAGEAGVIFKTFGGGVVTDQPPLSEGLQFVWPWNKVEVFEVRQQEVFEKMNVLSSNGLEIKLEASAWYQPATNDLGKLLKEKGVNYKNRILLPAIRSAARSVVGRYTPEQLYSSKRDAIQTEIYVETKKIVADQYIQLNEILVRDVTLPPTIKEAIERKLKQEQESLEYEFRLESARKEAEKVRIDAQGKADANRILNSSLTNNILKDKGIEATIKLSQSNNSKVIVIGSGDSGLPIILGNN
jgi:regulator of protease activity HflC (stomatin/prohibitin superfamily)